MPQPLSDTNMHSTDAKSAYNCPLNTMKLSPRFSPQDWQQWSTFHHHFCCWRGCTLLWPQILTNFS